MLITFLILAIILMPKLIGLYGDCDYYAKRYLSSIVLGLIFFIAFGIGYLLHFRFSVCLGLAIALVILTIYILIRKSGDDRL